MNKSSARNRILYLADLIEKGITASVCQRNNLYFGYDADDEYATSSIGAAIYAALDFNAVVCEALAESAWQGFETTVGDLFARMLQIDDIIKATETPLYIWVNNREDKLEDMYPNDDPRIRIVAELREIAEAGAYEQR